VSADKYTWTKREPRFRLEFSWHRERVVTVESRLILERGYPGGRGGYLGHDQVAINIASRRRSLHRTTSRPFRAPEWKSISSSDRLGDSQSDRNVESHPRRARLPNFSFTSLALLSRLRARQPCCSTFAASEKIESDVFIRGLYGALCFYRINLIGFFLLHETFLVGETRGRREHCLSQFSTLHFISDQVYLKSYEERASAFSMKRNQFFWRLV